VTSVIQRKDAENAKRKSIYFLIISETQLADEGRWNGGSQSFSTTAGFQRYSRYSLRPLR
jgi:hypothetical protein